MSHSRAEFPEFECSNCKAPLRLEVWAIIDEHERPDLIRKVQDQTLRQFKCHRCGTGGTLDAPVLIYRPGQRRYRLLLSPRDRSTAEQDAQEAEPLLTAFFAAVRRPKLLLPPLVVPWPALPLALVRDVDHDRLDPAWEQQVPAGIVPFYKLMLDRANRLNE